MTIDALSLVAAQVACAPEGATNLLRFAGVCSPRREAAMGASCDVPEKLLGTNYRGGGVSLPELCDRGA